MIQRFPRRAEDVFVVLVLLTGLLASCTRRDDPSFELGDGFFMQLHNAAPTVHVPGYCELWLKSDSKRFTVWQGVIEAVATNEICVFTAKLSPNQKLPGISLFDNQGPT